MIKQFYRFLHPRYQNLFLDYKVDLRPRYGYELPPHTKLYEIIDRNRDIYEQYASKTLQYLDKICEIPFDQPKGDMISPYWNNHFIPGLDIIILYAMIAENRPSRYVEIGSGHSTKVAYKAKTDLSFHTQIITIDPRPRVEIKAIADQNIDKPLENVEFRIFDELEENDILFVDNSHRILPNSDTTVLFLDILPRLKNGVIVHFHDIFLPYDYPQDMCDRGYSEQYGLAIYLLADSSRFAIQMPNYFISEDESLSAIFSPFWACERMKSVQKHGASFWMRIAKTMD